jgi:hypothetical protein
LGILKAFFVKMEISPGWLKQNIFLKSKMHRKKSLQTFSEVKNAIFSMLLMIV